MVGSARRDDHRTQRQCGCDDIARLRAIGRDGLFALVAAGLFIWVAQRMPAMGFAEGVLYLAVLLAMVGGAIMSSRLTRRVGEVSAATADIMAGHLERRLDVSGSGDEFDQLALHINVMLERLEAMVAAVRHVSDNIAHDLRTPLNGPGNELRVTEYDKRT